MKERMRAFLRTSAGRAITRAYRRLPRGIIFAAIFFGIVAVGACNASKYEAFVVSAATLTSENLHEGLFWLTVQSALLTAAAAFAGAAAAYFGFYGHAGMSLVYRPQISTRRRMRRTGRMSLVLLSVSYACMLVMPIADSMSWRQLRVNGEALRASWEIHELRQTTVRRLAQEQRDGHWWADPDDSDVMKDIKTALKETGVHGRREILASIDIRLQHPFEPKNPVQ
jgi:hypothetical protein